MCQALLDVSCLLPISDSNGTTVESGDLEASGVKKGHTTETPHYSNITGRSDNETCVLKQTPDYRLNYTSFCGM